MYKFELHVETFVDTVEQTMRDELEEDATQVNLQYLTQHRLILMHLQQKWKGAGKAKF